MSENPDRLAELLRQRTLVREQLAWLEREITAASGAGAAPESTPRTASAQTGASSAPLSGDAESSAPIYAPNPAAANLDTRRGCIFAFVATLLIFFAALVAIYLLRYRDHPLFFVPHR